ncbi:MAG: Ig-like domain-containing protein [Burkholderiales bacterium]|nr:Ig-like domain-containing protein [Burkholderiales bacterium]
MRIGTAARLVRSLGLLFVSVFALGAGAAQLTILLDTDNNVATGCTVATPGGPFAGVETVLTTQVTTTTSPPTIGAVTQQTCAAPPTTLSAAAPVSPGGWSVGVGVGTGGNDVIETFVPIGFAAGVVRVGFVYTDPVTGTDELVTTTGTAGGTPIIYAFAGSGGIAVPTLTDAGIFLLALLLCLTAARAMRRHKVPTTVVAAVFSVILATAAIAAVVLDGQVGDWTGIAPIANDPSGDAPPGSDIASAFAKHEPAENRIYFRVDAKVGAAPATANDSYTATSGIPLIVVAPGVLANDTLGVPAAAVASFGGGSAGGTVTTNAAGATATFGAGGSLVVNANGGFTYTPAAGFTGPFTFSYNLANANGTATATVTIGTNQLPAITSAAATTFNAGIANTFTVTATGFPVPALAFGACAPALPAGITFTDNANGTGTLAGNPPPGSAGTYNCTASATNAAGGPVNQAFTLTVIEGPITGPDSYTLVHDTVLTVPVGTGLLANDTGSPAPTVTSVTGAGPACTVFPCTIATANGSATVQANGSFTYTPNAAFAGTDGFTYIATNTAGSTPGTVTLTVTSTPPVVDLNGPAGGIDFGPAAFTEGGGAVAIVDAAQLTVTDADSLTLASATVVITNLLDGANESLAVTCPVVAPGCSGAILAADVTYTPATGTLAIARVAPLADYQALLRTLTYANAAIAPTTATNRDITVTVSDGIGANTPVAHATVALTATNNAPTVTAPATAVTPVNTAFNFAATVSVADPDAGTSDVQVTLAATNGTATLSGTAGLAVAGNGTASVTATGPIAAMNAALTGLLFTPTPAYSGPATLAITVNDQGNTGTGGPLSATATVNLTVDNLPTVTSTLPANGATSVLPGATITVNFSEAVTVTGSAFTLACPVGSPVAFTVAPASPAASFTLTPTAPLPATTTCTLTVVANQVTDSASQNLAANHVATFTTNTRPAVTSTVPANGAPAVLSGATITVNFSEPVNAALGSFTLACPAAQAFTLSASPATSYTLTPTAPLPAGATCTATVLAAGVTDVDSGQTMTADHAFTFTVATPPAITSAAATTFLVGSANSFTVTATGNPVPSLAFGACAPALPAGITFTDNANGTGTLAGNPAAGTAGLYNCTASATNAAGGPVNQGFALTIIQAAAAVNDSYTVVHDTVLNVPVGTGLLANDSGVPTPTVTSVTGSGPACTVFPCAIATTNGNATVQSDGSFTYTPTAAFAGTDGFSYVITNTGGSSGATVTIGVTSEAPVVDLNGPAAGIDFGPVAFTEGGGAVAIVDAAQLTVTDADSLTLASATVVITNLLDGANESLAVTCPVVAPGCSGAILAADVTYTPATGTLAIARVAPLADYQALLRTLTYANAAIAPTTATNRDITVTVSDGIGANTPVAHATVALTATNNAPTVTAPATAVTPVNTAFNFAATVSVADPDAGTSDVQVTLAATNGTATLSGTAGLVVAGNGTASVTATGPIAAMNTALTGLLFTPTPAYSGPATLAITVNDQGNTGTGGPLSATATVNLTVDNLPTVTSTLPANGAVSVATTATVTVNFSEAVTVTGSAFTLACPVGSPVAFTVAPASPAASFTLTPTAPLPASTTCTLTVVANQVTDSVAQNLAANHVATFTTNALPTVTSTVPANGATGIAPAATVTVNFSESVNATLASFSLQCPVAAPQPFTLSASPAASFTLTPTGPLPVSTVCTITVIAANVTDADASQAMAANFSASFTVATPPAITSPATATFTVGTAGSFNVTTTGDPTPAITRTGTLPANLVFVDNGNGTATISGTPAAGTHVASPYAQVITATNVAGAPTQNLSLRVCPVLTATTPIAQPTRTNAYSQTLVGSGGTGPYTFAVTGGALPGGLSMSGAGAITGTVTAAGAYSFTVTVTDTATSCTGTVTYAGTINEPPSAGADAYDAVGNTLLEVASPGAAATPKILVTASNVLTNDNDGNGGANGVGVTATAGTFASTNGGTVTMAANGTFTYLPPVNFTGADTFTYTVSDGIGTATGTVTVTVAHRAWYVRNNGSAGDGRSSTPFNTLAAAVTASSVNDTIFVFRGDGTSTNQEVGAVLKNGQRLVGEGVALDVPGTFNAVATPTLHPAGLRPLVRNATGDGVTLAANNLLKGFDIGTGTGTALLGANVGTLAVSSVSINNPGGGGVDLTGAGVPAVNVVLAGLTSGGGAKNVNLAGLGGTVNLGTGTLSGSTSHAFDVSGGTASVSYAGTISNTATGARVVSVANKTAGTVALSGAITSGGTNPAGVVLTTNTGATINLTGGVTLSTGTNPAFTATGGGTISVTGAANTLAATTATALNVANTTIGAAGLTFRSISSNGGSGTGIILDNTGASGSLTVTGTGAAGTGGTIANKTGADGATASGIGIYLNNTLNPSFSWMQLSDFANYAIRGFSVNGFTLANSVVSGVNGSTTTVGGLSSPEGSIAFGSGTGEFGGAVNGLTGSASLTSTSVSGGFSDNIRVVNQSGTLDRLTLNTVTVGANSAANGNDGLQVQPQGTATIKVTVTNSAFTSARGDLLQYVDNGSGSGQDLVITNSNFSNNHPAIATGGGGLTITSGTNNNLPLTITGNTFRNAVGPALLVVKPTGTGTLSGTISNNTIGQSGVANTGSAEGSALKVQSVGQGTVTVAITNNTIQQYNNFGIEVLAGGGASAQSGTINATITGNTLREPGTTAGTAGIPKNGVHLNIGTVPGDTFLTCAAITGNTLFGSGADAVPPVGADYDFRLRQRQATTIRLPGYGGANNDNTAVTNFIAANNPLVGTPTGLVANTVPTGGGYVGGAACPTP